MPVKYYLRVYKLLKVRVNKCLNGLVTIVIV